MVRRQHLHWLAVRFSRSTRRLLCLSGLSACAFSFSRCVERCWLGITRDNIAMLIRDGFRTVINNFVRLGIVFSRRITTKHMNHKNRMQRYALLGAFITMASTVGAFAQSTNVTTDVSVLYSGIVTPFNTALGISLAITGVLLIIWAVRRAIKARA